MSNIQYKVTNVTKWPGHKKGRHKNGFIIAINRRNVHVDHHIFVDNLTEAIESFHQKGWVKIEAVEDRSVAIREESKKTEAENEKKRKQREKELQDAEKKRQEEEKAKAKKELEEMEKAQQASKAASSIDKDDMKKQLAGNSEPKAKVSGDGHDESSNPLSDVEEAAYVDGEEPNFVVNASKKKSKGRGSKGSSRSSRSSKKSSTSS
jgi:ATPase subunit of ABC transporter with duplicated ATPase domains